MLYADAGYVGSRCEQAILAAGMVPLICEKGRKNNPLTKEQKERNREKSSIRCRIEHVFGFIEKSLHGSSLRCVGKVRAQAHWSLTAWVYNTFRLAQLAT